MRVVAGGRLKRRKLGSSLACGTAGASNAGRPTAILG